MSTFLPNSYRRCISHCAHLQRATPTNTLSFSFGPSVWGAWELTVHLLEFLWFCSGLRSVLYKGREILLPKLGCLQGLRAVAGNPTKHDGSCPVPRSLTCLFLFCPSCSNRRDSLFSCSLSCQEISETP
jgi:hypothetical protein